MNLDHLIIPTESGSTLLFPHPAEYGKLVEHNRKLAKNALIAGEPLADLSKEARKWLIEGAIEFTSDLGFNVTGPKEPDSPIIATGHQPIISHPGIALKIFALVTGAKKAGILPIFINQDCDEFRAQTVPAPMIENVLMKRDFTLFPQSGKATYESAQVEPASRLRERLTLLRDTLDHPRLRNVAKAMGAFTSRLEPILVDNKSFTSGTIILRRAWEGSLLGEYLETSVSILCQSHVFRIFTTHILRELSKFTAIYNKTLQQYRTLHKLRYKVNPFPDLHQGNEWKETPFWVMEGGIREKLYAKTIGTDTLIKSDTLEETHLDQIANGNIKIRPRAIVLSIYQRLFLCDLFIHGVGGAKYDTITDAIIELFFELTPPAYATVSATLFPDIEAKDYQSELNIAHQKLRDIDQRPEIVAKSYSETESAIKPLTLEKERLIAKIRVPGADKKGLGREIGRLNAEMSQLLGPIKQTVKDEIEKLEKLQKEFGVAHSRDYPFFLYQPEKVLDLLAEKS